MENYLKQEIIDKDDSNQIEITMEDLAGGHDDSDAGNDDHKFNLEFIKTLPCDEQDLDDFETENRTKVKTEPFDDIDYYENGHLLSNRDEEEDIRLLEKIKKETNIHLEAFPIKTETDTKDYPSEADWESFDHQRNYAFIKEDIELEDHCVKLETEKTCSTNRSDSDGTVLSNRPEKRAFECPLCSYVTHVKDKLKRHAASFHEDPSKLLWYYCTKCSYKTRQKGHLRRHDLIHLQPSEQKLFTCAICDYKFKQKCTLRRHINDVHTNSKRPRNSTGVVDTRQTFKCSECTYSTYKRGLLMSHLDKHKDTRDVTSLYICDICSFSTKYRRNLRVHLQTHQESQELQVYQCNVCRFSTRMAYCLKRHFLSRKHLLLLGKLDEYSPRCGKVKQENDS